MQILRNSTIIEEYIVAMNREINPSENYIKNIQAIFDRFGRFCNVTDWKRITQKDIVSFLDSLRKPEPIDPLHKWIGSYNTYVGIIVRFFKWLYYPDIEPDARSKPDCIKGLHLLKRKEKSIYKASDLWSPEDDLLFLKYCPNARDRAYHMVSRDSSCRPHEILNLRIKGVVFKLVGNRQYAEILVNGKTGSRHIPLINSIPYLKDWLDVHPQRTNHNAALFCAFRRCNRIETVGIYNIYRDLKTKYFPKLLEDPRVSPEDKKAIVELLKKPWNPYIRRHTGLTEKSKILKEHILKQHAGWSQASNMHLRYVHYFGNESSTSILEAFGIQASSTKEIDKLSPKLCPNCSEGNKVDSRFCTKCRMILSYDAYTETIEEKTDKITRLEETMNSLLQTLVSRGVLEPTKKNELA